MTHSCPKVSVLVTFYNQQDCVDRALESVFSQKCDFFFEVLIGDDGSSDKTWEKILEWRKKYPEQIREFKWDRDPKKNYSSIVRASNNRARLLEKARGEYLVFLDGDDYFLSNKKLQIQADILDSNPKISCCVHNVMRVDEMGTVLGTSEDDSLPEMRLSQTQYWSRYCMHAFAFMFRNYYIEGLPAHFDANNFDDNTIVMWFVRGDVHYQPQVMAAYVQEGESSWHSTNADLQQFINLNDMYYEFIARPDLKEASQARHVANLKWLRKCDITRLEKTLEKSLDELIVMYPYATKQIISCGRGEDLEQIILKARIMSKIQKVRTECIKKRCTLFNEVIGIVR